MSPDAMWVFVSLTGAVILFSGLALLQVGVFKLESGAGRLNDGLPQGRPSPPWRLADTDGVIRGVPGQQWQVLVFADHSLASFPDLILGLKRLDADRPNVELLGLCTGTADLAEAAVRSFGLQYPIVPVKRSLYLRYNVHAMPFVSIIDARGTIRASALVNDAASLAHIWRVAHVSALAPARTPTVA